MLIMTFSGGIRRARVAALMIRRLAWWGTKRAMSCGERRAGRREHQGARPIAEQDAGSAVRPVDNAGEHLRAHDEHAAAGAGGDELGAGGEGGQEARTGGIDVERAGPGGLPG